ARGAPSARALNLCVCRVYGVRKPVYCSGEQYALAGDDCTHCWGVPVACRAGRGGAMKAGRGRVLLVLICAAAGPLYLLRKVSVSPPAEVMTPHPLLLPHAVTWRFWQRVLESGQISAPLWKSLSVASGVALLALVFASPAAYSLAQLPLRWRYGV